MTETTHEPEQCDAPKVVGSDSLLCELDPGHEGWHQAIVTKTETLDFGTARYETSTREVITWQPLHAHLKRAIGHLSNERKAGRDADGGARICGTCGEEIDADDEGCPDEGRDTDGGTP